jgi:integrase
MEPYTAYNLDIIIKTWLNWCENHDLVEVNPLRKLKMKEPNRPDHPACNLDQVNNILTSASETLFVVIAIGAFTGLRIGEIAGLTPDDVDSKARLIHVRKQHDRTLKTKESRRSVPIHPRLLSILNAFDQQRGPFYVNSPPSNRYPNGDNHINPRDTNEHFQVLAAQLGYPVGRKNQGLTFHSVRRFFKTICLDSGVPSPLVDMWTGHKRKGDINAHYYRPQTQHKWINKVPFGDPNDEDIKHVKGITDED